MLLLLKLIKLLKKNKTTKISPAIVVLGTQSHYAKMIVIAQ